MNDERRSVTLSISSLLLKGWTKEAKFYSVTIALIPADEQFVIIHSAYGILQKGYIFPLEFNAVKHLPTWTSKRWHRWWFVALLFCVSFNAFNIFTIHFSWQKKRFFFILLSWYLSPFADKYAYDVHWKTLLLNLSVLCSIHVSFLLFLLLLLLRLSIA